MHHLPRFRVYSKRSTNMDRKKTSRRPKLERRNAAKHIEFDVATSSSSLDDSYGTSLYTHSLDIHDRTSFRIEGVEGEFDRICRNLGLSGPEDFAIPAAAWEAMKMRSSSDILPMTKALGEIDAADSVEMKRKVSLNASHGPAETNMRCIADAGACLATVGFGMKGFRPPLLKPPPSVRLPVLDNYGSTWDLLRDLAPPGETSYLEYEDEENDGNDSEGNERKEIIEAVTREVDDGAISQKEEKDNIGRLDGSVLVSEDDYLTATTNDDDSSSSTTEPFSNISPNWRFSRIITDWQKGELLGRGSFGSVYEGISDDGFFFAVKEVSLLDQGSQGRQSISQLEHEIALLSQFEHENIVQYYGTDKDECKLYIFLELVTKGSLANLYHTYRLRDSQVSAYTRQILHGLKYLHDQNVVHRDIKCANILVDANGSVKLADFGLAKATKLNDVKSCKGTAFWMAPEVVRGKNQGYGLPADMWSLGCTVLEMLTGQIPYAHLECMQALFRIGKGEPPPIPDSLSKDARDFIMQCLQVNPDNRPTAADLLNHPFVRRQRSTSSGSASPYHTGRRVNVSP